MIPFLYFSLLYSITTAFNRDSIEDCSRVLSENFVDTFRRVTGENQIVQFYEKFVEVDHFDPRVELKRSKEAIEKYLEKRAHFAHKAKVSLENRPIKNVTEESVNNPKSKDFIRFMSAKQGNDGTTIYEHTHLLTKVKVNETRNFNLVPNANFYTLPTSSAASAVHVPTPLYDRNPELLKKIEWSEIDDLFRSHREETRDLAFQLFCSESGYMRFYPAASWFWDNDAEHLDLFDCRNTEWYINAATNSKNVLIMLDMSGSMLGQRYEIAKQTTEAILETLSHNDYFNIMPFSKNAYFLDECGGKNGLLQATMRNKKALRNRMNNVTSEGKAEYEKAFPTAFNTLLNLPKDQWELYGKEEFLKVLENNKTVSDANLHVELTEHYLTFTAEYLEAVNNSNGSPEQGCENVIMLITDGAPNPFNEIFDLYNKDKKVRLFSFLIGEEAIDFEEVKQMACYNRGYMVHVQNMADVEEKVQHYIRTMSRPIGHHVKDIKEDGGAMWSGVYRERLYLPRPETFAEPVPITNHSFQIMNKMAARKKIRLQKTEARGRMFVTTVSYPVILNETFMGVAAVNIPLTEINQQAHPTLIGAKSYFFMLDQNGFIMTHPQLRPIDPTTKTHKPNYNNMDILELEVPQSQQTRKMVLDCDNSEPQKLSMLYATEGLDRVYPQTNTYYSECIKGSNFILGIAVAEEDDNRIKSRKQNYDYGKIELEWIRDKQWKLHPHWRYCLLNDTDTNITKEDAFTTYVQQMKNSGTLPKLCEPRKDLVHKILVDLEATSALQDNWDQQWQFHKDNLIHLVFFAAPSGLIRYYNQTLDAFDYIDPYWNIFDHIGSWISADRAQESYNHFITDLHRKSADDEYYKRSVRMKDSIVFQVSNKSKIWYKSETHYTGYGHNENLTVLAQATKAIYMDKAVLGVTGYEFAYDNLVNIMSEHGCKPTNTRRWCVLLDEHGYVFYSNDKDISYEDYIADPVHMGKHLGHWFGSINRVSQRAMQLLVDRKFYTKTTYTDHQAICKEKKTIVMSANGLRPLRYAFKWLMSIVNNILRLVNVFSLYPAYSQFSFAEAYTASFHDGSDGFPCSKVSNFYIANKDGRNRPTESTLIPNGRYDKPCPTTKCSVKMSASFVEGTNLVMVWIQQEDKSSLCYDDDACPKQEQSDVSFEFVRETQATTDEKCTGEPHRRPKRSKAMCYIDEFYPTSEPCSASSHLKMATIFLLILSIRVF